MPPSPESVSLLYTLDSPTDPFYKDLEGFYNTSPKDNKSDETYGLWMDYGTPAQNRPHNHCSYSVAHFQRIRR